MSAPRQCVWCGETFPPETSSKRRIHDACREARRRYWKSLWKLVRPRKGTNGAKASPGGATPQSLSIDNDSNHTISAAPSHGPNPRHPWLGLRRGSV